MIFDKKTKFKAGDTVVATASMKITDQYGNVYLAAKGSEGTVEYSYITYGGQEIALVRFGLYVTPLPADNLLLKQNNDNKEND